MSPHEFITSLSAHYSKRHASSEAEQIWIEDILAVTKGHGPAILRRAYEIIRAEHEERAFPLPATITKMIKRAAEIISPASMPPSDAEIERRQRHAAALRAPETREQIEAHRHANEWQHEMIREYGSWENYHRVVHRGGSPRRQATKTGASLSDISKRILGEDKEDRS